ncbi:MULTISPECIES: NAD(P)/FAD-dependent oxidoreductase [unclassified Paludibacterium]|uniref:NAD(P)/FAD-dependent oxidoreductase n=1 Tax=unclassified Paludibacterium TaxID=2618429 RepID=UPI00207B60DE|nr:FAD-dependent oxidoreductase [Paludibacterium sp. B53371]
MNPTETKRIAVIGSGISGLATAYLLNPRHDVTLFEAADYAGGHTHTVDIEVDGQSFPVDTGFLVCNRRTYPNLLGLLAELGITLHPSDMGFSVSAGEGELEWAGSNLNTVFAQRSNLLSPGFYGMLADILRFNRHAERYLQQCHVTPCTLGELVQREGYRPRFLQHYLLPMAAAIWSSPMRDILAFPAETFLRFCHNHGLLQVNQRPQWYTIPGGARRYVERMLATLKDVRLNTPVLSVSRGPQQAVVISAHGSESFDAVVFATHAPDTLKILSDPSQAEQSLLSAVRYQRNLAILHRDPGLLPRRRRAWSAWNYLIQNQPTEPQQCCVTYLLNKLQPLPVSSPVMVTLNPPRLPDSNLIDGSFVYEHPLMDQAAMNAQQNLASLQGQQHCWYAGAWTGYGFHEDGLKSALRVARDFGVSPSWGVL